MKLEGIDLAISQGAVLKSWSSSARDVVMRIDTKDNKEIFAGWSGVASTVLVETNKACSKFYKSVKKTFPSFEVWENLGFLSTWICRGNSMNAFKTDKGVVVDLIGYNSELKRVRKRAMGSTFTEALNMAISVELEETLLEKATSA